MCSSSTGKNRTYFGVYPNQQNQQLFTHVDHDAESVKFYDVSVPLFLKVDGVNVTHVELAVTALRINPTYSVYVNWSQSIVLGFFPAVLLMYFNTKIYLDVR